MRHSYPYQALLRFLAEGNALNSGPFRSHVHKLLDFLEQSSLADLDARQQEVYQAALARVRSESGPALKPEDLRADLSWEALHHLLTAPTPGASSSSVTYSLYVDPDTSRRARL